MLGVLIGVILAAAVTRALLRREQTEVKYELGLLRARLRTLVRLAEAGLIKPDTVEAATVLNEVHDMVSVVGAHPVRDSVAVVPDEDDDERDVPLVFR